MLTIIYFINYSKINFAYKMVFPFEKIKFVQSAQDTLLKWYEKKYYRKHRF